MYKPKDVSTMVNAISKNKNKSNIKMHFTDVRKYNNKTYTDTNNLRNYLTYKTDNSVISNIIVDNMLKHSVNITFRTFETTHRQMDCYIKGNTISFHKSSTELINILTDYIVYDVNRTDLIQAYEFTDICGECN